MLRRWAVSKEWEQHEHKYRLRPETYAAYVDVWTRIPDARDAFTSWGTFSQAANAEKNQRVQFSERVRRAEEFMGIGGYEIGLPTVRRARRWRRIGAKGP
jgi:hypothetical protein